MSLKSRSVFQNAVLATAHATHAPGQRTRLSAPDAIDTTGLPSTPSSRMLERSSELPPVFAREKRYEASPEGDRLHRDER